MSDAQKLIADVLLSHISRYRSGHYECLEPDCDWQGATLDAHAEHQSAEIDKALGGLTPRYAVWMGDGREVELFETRDQAERGLHCAQTNNEHWQRSGREVPVWARNPHIKSHWVSSWSEVQP